MYMNCLHCQKTLSITTNKFCSKSCSASYNNKGVRRHFNPDNYRPCKTCNKISPTPNTITTNANRTITANANINTIHAINTNSNTNSNDNLSMSLSLETSKPNIVIDDSSEKTTKPKRQNVFSRRF